MISSIQNYNSKPVFMNNDKKISSNVNTVSKNVVDSRQNSKFKIKKYDELSNKQKKCVMGVGMILATLSGIAIGRGSKQFWVQRLQREYGRRVGECSNLRNELSNIQSELDDVKDKLTASVGAEKNLRKINSELREMFTDLVNKDLSPKEIREELFARVKKRIEETPLNYDIMKPPVTGKGVKVYDDAVELPVVGTNNRSNMKVLDIPPISDNGSFNFVLPKGEMVASHMPTRAVTPVSKQPTTISIGYADAVNWDNNKIARDILQNFYDGHKQTLDGVRFEFTPISRGKYRVKISGDSTYTVDKALFVGESSKRDDVNAAGNFGEGLKMAVLKLLKDRGANNVKIASDNWKLTYELSDSNLTDNKVLSYSIDRMAKLNGNYLEFETTDKDLLKTLRLTINRFYHSGNEHFKCPDFENDLVGLKTNLAPGDKGGIYIAGQRFEFEGEYSNFDNCAMFIKEKPPTYILDISRDRVSLTGGSDMVNLGFWLAKMPKDDALKFLKSIEKYWNHTDNYYENQGLRSLLKGFILGFNQQNKNVHVKFPENCVAYSSSSEDVIYELESNGFKVCSNEFAKLGMPTIREVMGDARAHDVVKPSDVQGHKIKILKEAIRILGKNMEDKHFSADEIDTKIFLFDRNSAKDSKLYSGVNAEAIIDNGVTKGFWIDKNYLDNTPFSEILETCLHELSHKAGGDESAAFSYKLTNVNADAIDTLINNIPSLHEIQSLNKLWESLAV